MNILLIMDPGIPVPPVKYGGIERMVYLLANAYHKQGHQVTLLAGPGSHCDGKTVHYGVNDMDRSTWDILKEICFVWKLLTKPTHLSGKLSGKDHARSQSTKHFDLIHNFGRLLYLLPALKSTQIKIMSYQRKITIRNIRLIQLLHPKETWFTACSSDCSKHLKAKENSNNGLAQKQSRKPDTITWYTIYNAVDFSKYELFGSINEDAPLMFLGRLDPIKGAHTAIQVAKQCGCKLWIAGNIPENEESIAYYKAHIAPHVDGIQICYLGELDDTQKNYHLGRSKALLFPIQWDEPFGIVMIEAMACGTPVVAFNKGAVPEVVAHGKTGLIVEDISAMCKAIPRLRTLDRAVCRETARRRFDIDRVASEYLSLMKPDHHSLSNHEII